MKAIPLGEPKIIMSNPDSPFHYFGWPSITVLENGRIAVGASGFRLQHVCPFGKAVMSISEDFGETYSRPMPVIDTPLDDRDTGLLAFGKSGLIVTSFNNQISFQRSNAKRQEPAARALMEGYLNIVTEDEEQVFLGSTWRTSFDNGVTFGPLHKSPVTSPHGPLEKKDGTILWVGRMFEPSIPEPNTLKLTDCLASVELDPETGEAAVIGHIPDIYSEITGEKLYSCEPHAIELPDGRILVHIRVQLHEGSAHPPVFTVYQCESSDGGRTFSAPVRLLDVEGGAPPHLFMHSSGILMSLYARRKSDFSIRAMFSRDLGRTWDTEHVIAETGDRGADSWDIGYPATAELPDGTLLTVYYAHPAKGEPAVIFQQKWSLEA